MGIGSGANATSTELFTPPGVSESKWRQVDFESFPRQMRVSPGARKTPHIGEKLDGGSF
jgi:hypothetical protein